MKSFPSVANLTRHKYIFSRVKSTSCALIRSDWFSGSMRRQLSLDPLSARAEHCVTERGARTGLRRFLHKILVTVLKKTKQSLAPLWSRHFIYVLHDVWRPGYSASVFCVSLPGIHLSLVICVRGYTYDCDTAILWPYTRTAHNAAKSTANYRQLFMVEIFCFFFLCQRKKGSERCTNVYLSFPLESRTPFVTNLNSCFSWHAVVSERNHRWKSPRGLFGRNKRRGKFHFWLFSWSAFR